ncbi:hypothetical protein SAMN04490203_1896 [Pseudomonas taetrolens]|uniref:Uncharacterized protein n=1 Tax=Pseudomonas taetrolens TaxID=47884 RepID=A0A1H4Q6E6_PSETA|nr:hypothetical protein SAMN04490203_1896 [Pseudomonas taetrolens]SQF86050.1 Uncharacterised protein [Pseudomonas taetrolens]VEH49127.1 Uncharacterised protein [Pseudomonas taetrolens]
MIPLLATGHAPVIGYAAVPAYDGFEPLTFTGLIYLEPTLLQRT